MKRRGFTLVEMLVVITIVAILAFLAVSSYGVARKQAQLDIAVDSVISLMREQQGLAKSGRVVPGGDVSGGSALGTSESEKNCYGLRFVGDPEEGGNAISVIEMPYYKLDVSTKKVDYCDLSAATDKMSDAWKEIEVKEITQYGDNNQKTELYVVFKPPFGKLVLTDSPSGELKPAVVGNDPLIKISIGLANLEEERVFQIDSITGLTERVYE